MKRKTTPEHPISAKAYTKFTTRIKEIFASERLMCSQMLVALDLYLQGRPDYAEGLTLRARQALAFLLYDVDEAMTRSAKARARKRKIATEESEGGEKPTECRVNGGAASCRPTDENDSSEIRNQYITGRQDAAPPYSHAINPEGNPLL